MAKRDWMAVKVPYGGGYGPLNIANPKNARQAPKELHKEFKRQSIFLADNGADVKDLEWHKPDINSPYINYRNQNNPRSWSYMHECLLRESAVLFSEKNVLFLGGSHTITYTTFQALNKISNGNCGLIVLDAHPDCCTKSDWPIHSDWLRFLIKNHYLMSENLLIIGLRQIEKQEKEFLDRRNIKYYKMSSLKDIENFVMNDISIFHTLERFRKLKTIYTSIDIDVASGVYAPGTGCPSPGGFTDKELISLVNQFKFALPNLRVADIVEINPLNWWRKRIVRYDPTVDLGVKLIKEIIS